MKDVSGKVVAITGGALGMGRLTANKFAGGGARLALLDIKKEPLDQAVEEITANGGEAKGYLCDVSDRARVYEVFKQIENDLGTVDVLFNNAGVVFGGPLLEVDDEKLEKTIQINLIAHMWTMKAVLPGMIAKGEGHIINFSSMAGRIGVPLVVAYCASKTGVIGMTESLRQEMLYLKHKGIKFTIVEPSYVATSMFEGARAPLGTGMVKPEKMADLIYRACLNDKLFVRAPMLAKFVPFARGVTVTPMFDWFIGLTRVRSSMAKWTGRRQPPG